MSYYKSPSTQIFETASSASEPLIAGPGVAVVGFSTRGPINELRHFSSYEQFEKTMGKPLDKFPMAHMLAKRIFTTGVGTMYFVRGGNTGEASSYKAEKASVFVPNATGANVGRYFFKTFLFNTNDEKHEDENVEYLVFKDDFNDSSVKIKISIGSSSTPIEKTFQLSTSKKTFTMAGGVSTSKKVIPVDQIVNTFNSMSAFSSRAIMKKRLGDVLGIYIETKNFNENDVVEVRFLEDTEGVEEISVSNYIAIEEITNQEVGYETLLGEPTEGDKNTDFNFWINAKYPGSGMNGVVIKKTENKKSLSGPTTFNIEITESNGRVLESFSNLTNKDFISRINDDNFGSEYITIEGYEEFNPDNSVFEDGTYVLGEGVLLNSGYYSFNKGEEEPNKGTDGVPTPEQEEFSYKEVIAELLSTALLEPSLLNMDNVFFSIIATPDNQSSLVQDTAIQVAVTRGDSFYVADVPFELSGGKDTIKMAVAWHNGQGGQGLRGSAIETSYAGVFYGWTSVYNDYTGANLWIPPSVLVVPRMLLTDANNGVFSPPAGATRGRVVAYDYIYSPDIEDREEMMGGDNCINPIIYSNTRGLMIYGQKTADRTGSALNRINVRRMTNRIKSQLYTGLDVVRFELNNGDTRDKARVIATDILLPYRNAGALEGYTVNVQSSTGAERDVLNLYIDFVPVGLVERIRIFINITEGGLTATEG